MRTRLLAAAALPGLLAICCAASAAEPANGTTEVMFSGLKVGIDANTGRLRPLSVAESKHLDQMLTQGRKPTFAPQIARSFKAPANEAAARLTARPLRGGGTSAKVPESMMTSVVAHRDASGQLVIEHADAAGNATNNEGLPNE